MAKAQGNRETLNALRMTVGFVKKVSCTSKEIKEYTKKWKNGEELPGGIYRDPGYDSEATFYRVQESDLTEKEREEYLTLLRLTRLQSINRHLVFYTTFIILCIVVWFLILVGAGGSVARLFR